MTPGRSLVALLAGCLSALALASCGGGSEGRSTPEEALAKVRAADFARAVNLHADDVPYFEQVPEEEEDDPEEEERQERQLERCLGVEDAQDPLIELDSPTYGTDSSEGLIRVQSSVSVVDDGSQAAAEAALLRSDLATVCFRKIYVRDLEEEESADAEVRRARVRRLPGAAAGFESSFGYRFSAEVTVQGDTSQLTAYEPSAGPGADAVAESVTVPIYVDIVGFVRGRAAVSLIATGAPSPVSRTLERNLLRLLHERAGERLP